MTEAPDTEKLIALGIAAMFGSLLVHGLVAVIVGRVRSSFDAGLTTGSVLFGLTGLAIGAYFAWVLFVESAEVWARPDGCESVRATDASTQATAEHRLRFVASAEPSLRLVTAPRSGPCPAGRPATPESRGSPDAAEATAATADVLVRYRQAARQNPGGLVPAEVVQDPRQAGIAVGLFGAFGGFWFLAGLTMWASHREYRQPPADVAGSPARARWSTTFTVVGNLLVVGCLLGASFTDWDAERSTRFAFRGVALACVFYAAALALRRRLTVSMALTLLIIGGGFALAAWSLAVLG